MRERPGDPEILDQPLKGQVLMGERVVHATLDALHESVQIGVTRGVDSES